MASKRKRTQEFLIPYPKTAKERKNWNKWYGLNSIYAGKYWNERKKDSEYWHWLVVAELRRQKVPLKIFERPVKITFFWNDNLDIDNHAYMGKLIADALKGRLITDDNRRFYRSVCHDFHDGDHIRVLMEEV